MESLITSGERRHNDGKKFIRYFFLDANIKEIICIVDYIREHKSS